ncbi:LysR family transcriptional regulator [Clostridium sp. AM58-1XD]|uniref:LysR family transcriptional regulator n=1 Tax=Clostridium sp. AM58-1XD TaxID=2292307 RepID=UPI000E4FFC1B|nr:LysR family transcriptional regulator [Clostridium sp. AM58-1XD]RGY97714.1 LysR family transcriptional regulator [Clostridium sp. AM58-1XD]
MMFRELQYILAMAEEGSIAKAARRLYVAQPSLSQYLKKQEEILGVQLFFRSSAGLTPTAAGNIYIQTAKKILTEYEDMVASLPRPASGAVNSITFAVADQRGSLILPSFISRFSERYPAITLRVMELYPTALRQAITEGKVDIALKTTFFKEPQNLDNISYIPVAEEEVFLALPAARRFSSTVHISESGSRTWLELSDIGREPFVLMNEGRGLRALSDKLFKDNGIQPHILQYTGNMSTALSMVQEGLALTFVPKQFVIRDPSIEYVSIGRGGCFWTVSAMVPSGKQDSYYVNAVIQVLRDII